MGPGQWDHYIGPNCAYIATWDIKTQIFKIQKNL